MTTTKLTAGWLVAITLATTGCAVDAPQDDDVDTASDRYEATKSAATMEYTERLINRDARHVPTALSDHGWVASLIDPHGGFYWDAVVSRLSSSFSGIVDLTIEDLNGSGAYVGYAFPNGYLGTLAGGAPAPLPTICSAPSLPTALSDTGVVTGHAPCPGTGSTAFVRDAVAGQFVPILGLTGPASAATDISSSGRFAAGWEGALTSLAWYQPLPTYYSLGLFGKHRYGATDPTQAFRYDLQQQALESLTWSVVGVPAGFQVIATTALGINDDGAVVGYATLSSGSSVEEIPVLWPNPQAAWAIPMPVTVSRGCRATAINDGWQVVATCYAGSGASLGVSREAFVWDVTRGSRQLRPVTQNPTDDYMAATAINDIGQITVAVFKAGDDPGVALLTPLGTPFGSCKRAGACDAMYANQCSGHGGVFNPNTLCPLNPDPGPVESAL